MYAKPDKYTVRTSSGFGNRAPKLLPPLPEQSSILDDSPYTLGYGYDELPYTVAQFKSRDLY